MENLKENTNNKSYPVIEGDKWNGYFYVCSFCHCVINWKIEICPHCKREVNWNE